MGWTVLAPQETRYTCGALRLRAATVRAMKQRSYWWVSQGYNHDVAIEQQTLWSLPKKARDLPDRRLLLDMEPGDVVLHYSGPYLRAVSVVTERWRDAPRPDGYRMRPGDGDMGWIVGVDVQSVGHRLHWHDVRDLIVPGSPGPLDRNGKPMQIYVARLSEVDALTLLDAMDAEVPRSSGLKGILGLPETHWDDRDTDSEALTRIRREQAHLRRHQLRGRRVAPCALCGRDMPDRLLIAAHITPRRLLSDAERLDFEGAAMLVCTTGCDALFEWGYVMVDDSGRIVEGRPPETDDLATARNMLLGRACPAHTDSTRDRFADHRTLHTGVTA